MLMSALEGGLQTKQFPQRLKPHAIKVSMSELKLRPSVPVHQRTLLFEEVFEGLAGIHGPGGSRGFDRNLRRLHVGCGSSVLFHRGAEFIELAIVLSVFGSNTRGNGLGTFKLDAAVEESALLAAMKFEIALGTLSTGIEASDEDGTAIGATSAGDGSDHARCAGTEMIGSTAGSTLWRLAIGLVFFLLLLLPFGVAIAAVTVLTIHKCLRPSVLTDCNYTMYTI